MATNFGDTSSSSHVPMDRAERIKRFGIECLGPGGADGIFFKAGTWRPGGEYIQKLVIRNVSVSVKKLKYKLPSTRYFSLAYPEPIVLSPGLAQEVDVVFRPVEYEPYDDTIYIKLLDGIQNNGFHIPVRATIDNLSLRSPSGLDLGYCATHQITQLTFKLENTGEIDAPYEWDVPAPFSLVPSQGIVPVGQYHEITLSIMPVDASVYVAQAICKVGQGVHAIIPEPIIVTKLSAIGKYAYIHLSDALISFDEVVSGMRPDTKEIALLNNSVVPAEFSLIRLDEDRDEVFDIQPKFGVIPPLSEIPVVVSYKALAMGCYSHDRYAFRTPGSCNTVLDIKGMSMPPKVALYRDVKPSPDAPKESVSGLSISQLSLTGSIGEEGAPLFSLNFRDIEVDRVETRILYICNESPRAVPFSIVADENGIFQMSPKQGVIPPLTKAYPITLKFSPQKPINYYRRFFVLIEDAQPLFYDCLGTGFIRAKGEVKEQRPAPIRHAHVQAYRNRAVEGYGGLSPEELDQLYQKPEAPSGFFAHIGRTGTRALSVAEIHRPVTRTGESIRPLIAPAHEYFIEDTDGDVKEVILNRGTLNFGYTAFRSSSLPQSITIHNNTRGKVVVQWYIPVVKGLETQSGLRVSKDRELISVDKADKELAMLQAFQVSPLSGDINPGQSQNFQITFCPKQSNRNFINQLEAYVYFKNQRTFRLVNDFSLTPPWTLSVNVLGHTFSSGQLLAKASFQGGGITGGKLVFPCCFQGESMYQTFMITNTSNLPCLFSLNIGWNGSKSDGPFSVKPSIGEIDAESFVLVCVRFSPTSFKKYTDLLRLTINGDEGGKLVLEGQGAIPYLIVPDLMEAEAAAPEQIWGIPSRPPSFIPKGVLGDLFLKPTSVGLSSTRTITLKNASRLPLRYRVSLPQSAQDVLSISPLFGTLKGNDDVKLQVVFSPRSAKAYSFKAQVNVYPIGGKPKKVIDSNQPGPVDPPELLQSFSMVINAQGEVGALTFAPAHTDIKVRLVHTSEEKSIWLENVSDSDLSYCLFYKEEFEADVVDRPISRVTSEVMPLIAKPSRDNHDVVSRNVFQHSLFCEQPSGMIGARSRSRIVFTYCPIKSGLFDFSIYAQVQAVDAETKRPVMISNDEAALIRMGRNDIHQMEAIAGDLAKLPLTASISGRAAFPKLLFEDIRTDYDIQISDVNYLWKRFSFAQMNYDLSLPLTSVEIAINNSSSPDLSKLKIYPLEFAPAVVNSPLQSVTFQLRNHGYLDTAFHMHFPNEKQLELENWCDEDDPSEALNRLISIIEELKLFSIEPKEGYLKPGETCIVKISYKHSSLKYQGIHNIPIMVRVSQGKQFYLDIRGRTLANASALKTKASSVRILEPKGTVSSSPSIADHASLKVSTAAASAASDCLLVLGNASPNNILTLSPVPIGLSTASSCGYHVLEGTSTDSSPLQRTELINVSAQTINYEVFIGSGESFNLSSDDVVRGDNHNLEVLKIANPTGTIPAGASVLLDWYFYPLEAREYSFPFVVRYKNAAAMDFITRASTVESLNEMSMSSKSPTPSRKSTSRSKPRGLPHVDSSAPSQPQVLFLHATLLSSGFDPRQVRPKSFESQYIGGLPSPRPILVTADKQVTLFEDSVDFQLIPQRSTVRRLVTIINRSPTATFDFAFDETSCGLSVDGLLNVKPLFGRLEPMAKCVVELSFTGLCQAFIFEDHIKIMIREVIKGAGRSRGGTKQQLLNRIKARKTQSTEHESVVSHLTFARTMQVVSMLGPQNDDDDLAFENAPISPRKAGKFPTTITSKGELVVPDMTKTIRALQPSAEDDLEAETVATGERNSIVEIDMPNELKMPNRGRTSFAALETASNQRGLSSGMSRGTTGRSKSELGSRGASSGLSRTGSTDSRTGHQLFGTTYILIVRMRGELYSEQTVRLLLQRAPEAIDEYVAGAGDVKDALQQFLLSDTCALSTPKVFIPPVGKKFFDAELSAEYQKIRAKAKVNLSFVSGRDAELREIAQTVFQSLVGLTLSQKALSGVVKDTIDSSNSSAVSVLRKESIGPFPGPDGRKVGVYFKELTAELPLHLELVAECRALGYSSSASSPPRDDEDPHIQAGAWHAAGAWASCRDHSEFSLAWRELKTLLHDWQLRDHPSFAKELADMETAMAVSDSGSETVVQLREWTYRLSKGAFAALREAVKRARDKRERPNPSASSSSEEPVADISISGALVEDLEDSKALLGTANTPSFPREDPLLSSEIEGNHSLEPSDAAKPTVQEVLTRAMSQEIFAATAAESLSALFLSLLREEISAQQCLV